MLCPGCSCSWYILVSSVLLSVLPSWMYFLYWLRSRSAFAPSLLQLLCTPAQVCFCKWCSPVLNLLLLRLCSALALEMDLLCECGPAFSTRLCSCSRRYSECAIVHHVSLYLGRVQWSGYAPALATLPGVLFDWCNRLTVSFSGPLADVAHR